MGIEYRDGNGPYYYRKERVNGKVQSVYSSSGELALLEYRLEERRKTNTKQKQHNETMKLESDRNRFAWIDSHIDSFCELADSYDVAIRLLSGYHQHSRAWRRRNG